MKKNLIHVCFVIDESGSMCGTESDVVNGFKKVIDEQKENKDGECLVSYYKFATNVTEVYKGINVNEVEYLDGKYSPNGLTALFDGVGIAIDDIGKWLDAMPEDEKPEKNLIVIMTDGGENNSKEYSASRIKEMIKHQEEKYSWSFVYMGSDISDADDANSMGISTRCFSSKGEYFNNYLTISNAISCYRNTTGSYDEKNLSFCTSLNEDCDIATEKYAQENNIDVSTLKSK